MIYSKRHAKSVHLVGYKGIVTEGPIYITCPIMSWKFFDLSIVTDPTETTTKLKAIGIDPAFLNSDPIDYEAGFNEFLIDCDVVFKDYEAMFLKDDDGQS